MKRFLLGVSAIALILSGIFVFSSSASATVYGDDYPTQWRNVAQDSVVDSWGEYNRECTSFVAWRLHSKNGFEMPFHADAGLWKADAQALGYTVDSTPAVGSVAWNSGHVAWVAEVPSSTTVTIEDYNHYISGNSGPVDGAYHTSTVATSTYQYIHFKDMTSSTPASTPAEIAVSSLTGKWVTGSTGQDIAYISKSSDGGFSVAVWKQTPTGIQWQGNWWTQSGSSGVTYDNTKFFVGDVNGDGLVDLYYATSTNWNAPGFSVSIMNNTGSGLSWGGGVWTESTLKLKDVQFLPGDWTGNGRDGFAYVTPNGDNGFSVAVFASTTSGLAWQGVWWTQAGNTGVQFSNTKFITADANGDGRTDIYYASSQNWDAAGFGVGLMSSTGSGLTWSGTQWAESTLKLKDVRFLPGYWNGTSREGFAYVTRNSDGGFAVAVFASTTSGLAWQGVWWPQPGSSGVLFDNTIFSSLDMDDNGYTDLYYTTSANWANPSLSMALQHNTGSGGFSWWGTQWNANLPLNTTKLLPQG